MRRKIGSILFVSLLVVGSFVSFLEFGSEKARGTNVSGIVYDGNGGPWTPAGSPYIVVDDIGIPAGETLTVEPGVEVRFNGYYDIWSNGNLHAVGTPGNLIQFTSNSPTPASGDWEYIAVNGTGRITMSYCNVMYSDFGVVLLSSSFNLIQNSEFSMNFVFGMYVLAATNSDISNNDFSINGLAGIYLTLNASNNQVIDNDFHDHANGYGIYLYDDWNGNNTIWLNSIWANDIGIVAWNSSYNQISYNLITGNTNGVNNAGVYFLQTNHTKLTDNNISLNDVGIYLEASYNNIQYHNDIIDNPTLQAGDDTDANTWNDTYPSGGNHWSDWDEPAEGCDDLFDGPTTPQVGGGGPDGICDVQYDIDADSIDYYPLVNPVVIDAPPIMRAWEPGGSSGQWFMQGDMITVTWNATDDNPIPPNTVNISYGNTGVGWTQIATDTENDGVYDWDTSLVPCPDVYWMNLSVRDSNGKESYDLGNFSFNFICFDSPPTIEAWEPGGTAGQTYTQGDMVIVTWTTNDDNPLPPNPINITYGNLGVGWTTVATDEPDDGIYNWDTSSVLCPEIYWMNLTVYDSLGQTAYDWSNFSFTMLCPDLPPTIEAWEPGGTIGQVYTQGDMVTVTWTATDDNLLPPTPINITYGDPFGGWTPIANDEPNDGIYDWDTSAVPCPGSYWMNLSVYDSAGQEVYDWSNTTFGIACPPDLPPTIEAWEPGGTVSQTYTQGDMVVVTWNATDDNALPANPINITYWDTLLAGWQIVSTDEANDGVYNWDTSSIACPNTLQMNLTVYDSAGQETYDVGNFTFELQCPSDTLTVSGIPLFSGNVYPGDTNIVIEQLTLSAGSGSIEITDISVDETGTAVDADTDNIYLYDDINDNAALDIGTDILLGTQTFVGGALTFTGLTYTVTAGTDENMLLVVDISPAAATGVTVCLTLVDDTYVIVTSPDIVSPANFPISNCITIVAPSGDVLTVSGTPIATGSVNPGDVNVVMEWLTLTAGSGSVTVTDIRIDQTGTGVDLDTGNVYLYDDLNNDGVLDGGDTLLDTQTFTGGTLTFTGLTYTVTAGTPENLLIVLDVAAGATICNTLQLTLVDNTYVTLIAPDVMSPANFPINSNEISIGGPCNTLTVSGIPIASGTVNPGDTDIVMEALILTADANDITVTAIQVEEWGTGVDADTGNIYLYDDLNANLNLDGSDILLDTKNFIGDTLTFTPLSITVTPGGKNFLIVLDVAPGATLGNTLQVGLLNNLSVAVNAPDSVSIANFPISSNTVTIQAPVDTLTVSGTPVASGNVFQSETNVVMERLTLSVNANNATVTSIKVDQTGTGLDTDTDQINLYDDTNGNTIFDAGDQLLDTQFFVGSTLTFTPITPLTVTSGTPRDIFILFNITAFAVPGDTLRATLVDNSYVTVSAPDSVATTNFPIDSNVVTIVEVADELTVTGTAITSGTVNPGDTDIVMEQLTLNAGSGTIIVNDIRVDQTGTGTDADTVDIYLYEDVNDNAVLEIGTDVLLDTQTFTTGTLTFTPLPSVIVTTVTDENLLIVFDIAAGATPGNTLRATIVDDTYVTVTAPDTVAPFATINSNFVTIASPAGDTVTVSGTPTASGNVLQGDTVVVEQLTLSVDANDATITDIQVDELGTAVDADTSNIYLYDDVNDNGALDIPGDILLDTQTLVGDTLTFTGLTYTISAGTDENLLIVLEVDPAATAGSTIQLSLANNGYVTVNGPDVVSSANFPIDSNILTIQAPAGDILTVSGMPIASGNVLQGDTVVVEQLTLSVDANDATVTDIQVDELGTAVDADTGNIYLYDDANDNGALDIPGDTLLDAQTLVGDTLTFTSLAYTISAGTDENLLIVLEVDPAATAGSTIQLSLANNGYVTVIGPDVVSSANFPIDSNILTIQAPAGDILTASGTPKASGTVLPGENDVVMEQLKLSADANTIDVTSILIDQTGSGVDADTDNINLYDDANDNGVLDLPGDTLLDTQTFSGGTLTFTIAPALTVTAGTDENLLIVFDIAAAATPGNTLQAGLLNSGYVTVSAPDSVSTTNFPTNSNVVTILLPTDILTVTGTPKTTGNVFIGETNVVMEQLTLSVDANDATVTAIQIDEVGTGVDTDTGNIYLYDDVNDDGSLDAGDSLLDTQTFTGGTLTFSGLTITVTAGTDENLLIVFDIAVTATVGNTLQLTLINNGYVVVNAPDTVSTANFPISSNPVTIVAPSLTVAGTAITSGNVNPGDTNIVMEQLTLTSDFGIITVTDIKMDQTGTGVDADTGNVYLYDDVNNDGSLDAGDVLLGMQTFALDTLTFTGLSYAVTTGTPENLLIVFDIAAAATDGNTLRLSLFNNGYVTVNAPDVVSVVNFPMNSNIITITSPPVTTGDIIGTVEDGDGNPIQGATVTLKNSTGAVISTTTTDSNGNFTFTDIEQGTAEYNITFVKTGYDDLTITGVSVIAGVISDVDTIVMTETVVPPTSATLNGTVVDENGDPIEDVKVKLIAANGTTMGTFWTDSNGNYQFPNVPFGDYKIEVSKSGYATMTTSQFTVNADRTLNDIKLEEAWQPPEGEDFLGNWWWLIVLIVVIIIVVILLAILLARRKKPEPVAIPPEEEAPQQQTLPPPQAPPVAPQPQPPTEPPQEPPAHSPPPAP